MQMNTTNLLTGKRHIRARAVLNQIKSGRLTLQRQSLLPDNRGRGRAYSALVENIIDMQPGGYQTYLLVILLKNRVDARLKDVVNNEKGRIHLCLQKHAYRDLTCLMHFSPIKSIISNSKSMLLRLLLRICSYTHF